MKSYDEDKIEEVLKDQKNVAVVGISDKPERDSYRVAQYLQAKGYNIIPINPKLTDWNGIKAYPDLSSIPPDVSVDVVDIFRKSDAVLPIVKESLKIEPKVIWMQEEVVNEEAADLAKENGLVVIMNRCMMKEHKKLFS